MSKKGKAVANDNINNPVNNDAGDTASASKGKKPKKTYN